MLTMNSLVEVLKLTPRYFVMLGLFCGAVLLLPQNATDTFGVSNLAQNYRQWFGITFLLSMCGLAVYWGEQVIRGVRNRSALQKAHARILKRLNSLTEEEKQILRYYLAEESKTNTLRIDDGVVSGLEAHGVIYRAVDHGDLIEGFAYNISEVAWEYLNENHGVLNGSTRTYRTDKRKSRW